MGKTKSVASTKSSRSSKTVKSSRSVKGKGNRRTTEKPHKKQCKLCDKDINAGDHTTDDNSAHLACEANRKQFYYNMATDAELKKSWQKFSGTDTHRATAVRKKFVVSGRWDDVVECIRTHSKSEIHDSTSGLVKRNELSFRRHFLSAGLKPNVVDRMWAKGVDETGRKLQRTTTEKGEEALLMDIDEVISKTHKGVT
jgi:hypothetical protein